jgi:hypothetical protein
MIIVARSILRSARASDFIRSTLDFVANVCDTILVTLGMIFIRKHMSGNNSAEKR